MENIMKSADITQASKYNLNQGQQSASEAFFSFLFSSEKEMGIDGPGGVGKSFLMAHLIDEIIPRYEDTCELMGIEPQFTEVIMLAMTNKAAEVLSQATQRPVQTLHSFLNLKVVDDYSTGRSKITKTAAWRVHTNKIIFIDEASMLDTVTAQFLSEGTHDCKIIFVGDDRQLSPVTETISPIYRSGIKFHTLTEQMRTNVPEIQALHEQLRETVHTGEFKPIQIIPGIIDYLDDNQMQETIKNTFTDHDHNSRILAYTNNKVIAYNDYIRELRHLPNEYTVGELLVNNTAIRLNGNMLSVEAEIEIRKLSDIQSELIDNNEQVYLSYRTATIQTTSGGEFTAVKIPTDRSHYDQLVRYYKKHKNWERFFYLKNNFPDFRPRDAATVYKAQGSTYDTGFIDLTDISTCRNPDQVARMLYVGCSRERHRIYLYGQLNPKFGGIIV